MQQDGIDDDASERRHVGNTVHLQTSSDVHVDVRGKERKKNSDEQRKGTNIKTTKDCPKHINNGNEEENNSKNNKTSNSKREKEGIQEGISREYEQREVGERGTNEEP